MLNLPNELRCIVISHLGVPPFCTLRETCKWFSQDVLWDIYLKSMHTKSKCLDDHNSSPMDKIKYIHQIRDCLVIPHVKGDQYTLHEVNNYELRHNIQLPIDVKAHLIEPPTIPTHDENEWSLYEHPIDLNDAPVIKPNGDIEMQGIPLLITLKKNIPSTVIKCTFILGPDFMAPELKCTLRKNDASTITFSLNA